MPRSYRLPYSRPLADKSLKARDEIMSGNPQEGIADDLDGSDKHARSQIGRRATPASRVEPRPTTVDQDQFRLLQQAQRLEFRPMPVPTLPPKP